MEQAACHQLIDYGGQCFDRHVFQSGGVLAELPQRVLAALAAVGDVVALVAVGNVEQAFVHIRPEHAEFLPCGAQLRVAVQADVARPPVQSNFSVSAHVSTSLYPTAGTDKKLTTNGQLRKKIFREIKNIPCSQSKDVKICSQPARKRVFNRIALQSEKTGSMYLGFFTSGGRKFLHRNFRTTLERPTVRSSLSAKL